jgi:hypothetical protein
VKRPLHPVFLRVQGKRLAQLHGATAFRMAEEALDMNLQQSKEHLQAASDDGTRHRTTALPWNPGVYCRDILLTSPARKVYESFLSTSNASLGDYMDCEPAASEYDVAS